MRIMAKSQLTDTTQTKASQNGRPKRTRAPGAEAADVQVDPVRYATRPEAQASASAFAALIVAAERQDYWGAGVKRVYGPGGYIVVVSAHSGEPLKVQVVKACLTRVSRAVPE